MVICAEAGLSLDATLVRVSRELANSFPELAEEFAITAAELTFCRIGGQRLRTLTIARIPTPYALLSTLCSRLRNLARRWLNRCASCPQVTCRAIDPCRGKGSAITCHADRADDHLHLTNVIYRAARSGGNQHHGYAY